MALDLNSYYDSCEMNNIESDSELEIDEKNKFYNHGMSDNENDNENENGDENENGNENDNDDERQNNVDYIEDILKKEKQCNCPNCRNESAVDSDPNQDSDSDELNDPRDMPNNNDNRVKQQKVTNMNKLYICSTKTEDMNFETNSLLCTIANFAYESGDLEEAERYYLVAIEKESWPAMRNYAIRFLYASNCIPEAISLFEREAELSKKSCTYLNISLAYADLNNKREVKSNLIKALELLCNTSSAQLVTDVCNQLVQHCSLVELYNFMLQNIKLHEPKEQNKFLLRHIEELEAAQPIVQKFKQKIVAQLKSNYEECPICLNENIDAIPTECEHYFCTNCYCILKDNCPICCRELEKTTTKLEKILIK